MKLTTIGLTIVLVLGLFAARLPAEAQQAGKVTRIGFLGNGSPPPPSAPMLAAFRQGLRDLGWTEGENLTIEYRWAEGKLNRLPGLAAELVGRQVDVLVAAGTPGPLALKRSTTTIPIVMLAAGDPVGTGLVASLARPGGNVTGLGTIAPDLAGKKLETLSEVVPGVSRVAFLWNAANPFTAKVASEVKRAAQTLGVTLLSLEVRGAKDFESAFEAAIRGRVGALFVQEDPLTYEHRTRIVEFAATHRLPALYGLRGFVLAGGLMAYAVDHRDLFRRAATYVDQLLKGAKPADLPVQQPTKFVRVINLKTAKALGLTIPPSLLSQADEVIR